MHKQVIYALLLLATFAISSCGEQQKAKSIVKDFITNELRHDSYSIVEWGRQDSTFHLSAKMLKAMHDRSVKGATYAKPTEKLIIQKVTYVNAKDTIRQTFYLDENLTGIVGYKTDEN